MIGAGIYRRFKGDRHTRACGSRVPIGAIVEVIKFYPRRRALILHKGESILTMTWCLEKITDSDFWNYVLSDGSG